MAWLIYMKAGMLAKCIIDELQGRLVGQRISSMGSDRSQAVDNKANIVQNKS